MVQNYFWTENTTRGEKTVLLTVLIDSALKISSYRGEVPKVEQLENIDDILAWFPATNAAYYKSELDVFSMKHEMFLNHYQQTSRCRSSRFSKEIIAADPATRGNVFVTRRKAFSFSKSDLEFTVGLEINTATLKVKGLAVIRASSLAGQDVDEYIGVTQDRVLRGGNLSALLGFNIFSESCIDQYDKIRNIRLPNLEDPNYDVAIDSNASFNLDLDLGTNYRPQVSMMGEYVSKNISEIQSAIIDLTFINKNDPLYIEIQKKENSNE